MPIIFTQPDETGRQIVQNILHQTTGVSAEVLARGIEVSSVPEPIAKPRKSSRLIYADGVVTVEYFDRPATIDEIAEGLEQAMSVLKVLALLTVPKWSKGSAVYEKNDIVRLNNGTVYKCLTDHISQDIYKPNVYANYWSLLASL